MPIFAYQARDEQGQRVSGTHEAPDQHTALEALRANGLFITKLAPVGTMKTPPAPVTPVTPAPIPANSPFRLAPEPPPAPVVPAVSVAPVKNPPVTPPVAPPASATPPVPHPVPPSTPAPTPPVAPRREMPLPPSAPLMPNAQAPGTREMPPPPRPVAREAAPREVAPQTAPLPPSFQAPEPLGANREAPQMPGQMPRREVLPREAQVPETADALRQQMPTSPIASQPLLTADAKQLSLFFRQMHVMIHAGSSVAQALTLMSQNAPNAALRRAAGEMSTQTARGYEWNQTMRSYPGLFSELMVGMVAAGEHGGFLDRILARLANYSERDYEIQQTVKRETWYPKVLLAMSFLIPSVVPLVLGGFGAWWESIKGVVFFALFLFVGWKIIQRVAPGALARGPQRAAIDEFKLRFPVAGKFVRSLAAAKFCRALGAMQSAGMGLHKTIDLAAAACGNEAMARQSRRIIHRLDQGESLTTALTSTGQFPPLALQMLSTGEASGSIETQLDKVADFLEADAETAIKQAVTLLGVAVFLLVAIRVGIQVIGFYTGYFNNIESTASELSK